MNKIDLLYSSEVDQVDYLKDYHRSGWAYVLKYLQSKQNDGAIICDTYVDRTFHWLKPTCIPYTKPWIGFIHHTFDTKFSNYNNVSLLKNIKFLHSLLHCKTLFVFGTISMKKWELELKKLKLNVPVISLVHPTEFPTIKFDYNLFKENSEKKIVQIGAWLRDNYAIFRLNNGKSPLTLGLQKCALIGKDMENYYKPPSFFEKIRYDYQEKVPSVSVTLFKGTYSTMSVNAFLPTTTLTGICRDGVCRNGVCRDASNNKYVKGAFNLLQEYDKSVQLIKTLSNDDYDDLLSKNVVFLSLVDGAAINTLNECIVRNTPIIINPIPSVVELLGINYPLYYNNLDDILKFDMFDIKLASEYLETMIDKRVYDIKYFAKSFEQGLEKIKSRTN